MADNGIQFGVTVDSRGVRARLARMPAAVERAVKDALDRVAAMAQAHAREGHPKVHDKYQGDDARRFRRLTGQRAGRFTGQPRFLTRTGVLRNSVKIEKARRTLVGVESGIFSAVKYADRVEFGGPNNPPYPFMRPAAYYVMQPMQAMLAKAARAGLGGA